MTSAQNMFMSMSALGVFAAVTASFLIGYLSMGIFAWFTTAHIFSRAGSANNWRSGHSARGRSSAKSPGLWYPSPSLVCMASSPSLGSTVVGGTSTGNPAPLSCWSSYQP